MRKAVSSSHAVWPLEPRSSILSRLNPSSMPYARPTTMSYANGHGHPPTTTPESASTCCSSTQGDDHSPSSQSLPAWQNHVSAAFSQLSEKFQAASHAVSTITPSSDHAMATLIERLDNIEEGQKRLEAELNSLKEQFLAPDIPPTDSGLEAMVKEQIELFKLDQERLPARLQNALATKSLSPIKMLPMKNHKFPLNFPSTRGEFEHLTKERYENLMTSYDIPISGDTAAKRESLRTFLGIPTSQPDKK